MLVLTRKVGEKLMIGDDITLTVVEMGRNSIRLGIEAPDRVQILRFEVLERIQEENRMASEGGGTIDITQVAAFWRQKGNKGENG